MTTKSTKSNEPRVTLAQSKTPMPLKNKAVRIKRAAPKADAHTKKLVVRVVKFCEDHDITAYELSLDSKVPKTTCERLIGGGDVYYLKRKTIDKLTHWLEVSTELEATKQPYYAPVEVEPFPQPEEQLSLPLVDNELHGTVTTKYHDEIVAEAMRRIAALDNEQVGKIDKLSRQVATLETQVSDLARAFISLQVKVGL